MMFQGSDGEKGGVGNIGEMGKTGEKVSICHQYYVHLPLLVMVDYLYLLQGNKGKMGPQGDAGIPGRRGPPGIKVTYNKA